MSSISQNHQKTPVWFQTKAPNHRTKPKPNQTKTDNENTMVQTGCDAAWWSRRVKRTPICKFMCACLKTREIFDTKTSVYWSKAESKRSQKVIESQKCDGPYTQHRHRRRSSIDGGHNSSKNECKISDCANHYRHKEKQRKHSVGKTEQTHKHMHRHRKTELNKWTNDT